MSAPLVGRDELVDHATRLLDDGGGGVVLVGEGGVGKSRLASEILRIGTERGYAAVSTVGTQAATAIPLGALSHLLPDLRSDAGNVLIAARAAMTERAAGRRLLLSVDDAHLLDDHSAALVLQLAMSMPSFVVATIRTGEPVPDPVLALWKEGLAERIEVGRLDAASIEALAAQVLGGPVSVSLAKTIASRADGNALLARELCLAGRDSAAIGLGDDGRWVQVGELGVSARLVELVAARIDDLDVDERAAIELVAHAEPIGLDLAIGLSDASALGGLERRGVVVLREDGRRREVWLSHPMYAEVVRATTGLIAAASIKGRLATATVATGMRRRSDLLRVATWQLEAGKGDAELLLRAATETYRAGDMIGTARLAAGSWDLEPTPVVGRMLGIALGFSGRYAEADAIFAAAAELATDEPAKIRIAMVHAAILSAGMGQPEAAIELLATTEAAVHGDDERAILQAQRAHLLALGGDVDASLAITEPLLERYDDGPVLVTAAMASMIALQLTGAYARVVVLAERALPETRRLWAAGEVSIPPSMLELEAFGSRVSMGEIGELPSVGEAGGMGPGSMVVNRPVAILAALHQAAVDLHRGRPRSAATALEAVGPVASDLLAIPVAALLTICAALQGRADDAREALARMEAWRRPGNIYDPFGDTARIWTAVATGRPESGRRLAAAALDDALDTHRWGQALGLAHTLARIGEPRSARLALDRIGDRVDGRFAVARRDHILALDGDDAGGLEVAAQAFEDIGAVLLAAEATADASRAWRRAGDPRRATRLARQSEALVKRCEGVRTPALIVVEDELTPLSRREREVADLAAAGMSSEEIAGRLFLSVRTVDNHLGHVYQKLGITSRTELAMAFGRRPRPGAADR